MPVGDAGRTGVVIVMVIPSTRELGLGRLPSAGGTGLVKIGDEVAPVGPTVTGWPLPAPLDPQGPDRVAGSGVPAAQQPGELIKAADDPAHGGVVWRRAGLHLSHRLAVQPRYLHADRVLGDNAEVAHPPPHRLDLLRVQVAGQVPGQLDDLREASAVGV